MMYKAIIFDVDGTLTVDRESDALSTEAIEAIRELIRRRPDMDVGLATGNCHLIAYALARYIGLNARRGPIISENGCILWYNSTEHVLCTDEHTRSAYYVILSELKDVVIPSYQSICRRYDFAFYSKLRPEEVMLRVEEVLRRYGLSDKVRALYSGYAFHVMPVGVDKGRALMRYCEIAGISPREVIVVGDSETDLPMFRVAGLRVAVANSDRALKDVADIITREPSGRGVREFIYEHLLGSRLLTS